MCEKDAEDPVCKSLLTVLSGDTCSLIDFKFFNASKKINRWTETPFLTHSTLWRQYFQHTTCLATCPSRLCIIRPGTVWLLCWRPIKPVWSFRSPLVKTTSLRSKLSLKGATAAAAVPSAYQRCQVSSKCSAACKWLELELCRKWDRCTVTNQLFV